LRGTRPDTAHLRQKPVHCGLSRDQLQQADITPRQRVTLDFSMKVALQSQSIRDDDFAQLGQHGFGDEDSWDIGAITPLFTLFGLSNCMTNLISMQPNAQWRVPPHGR
jgi:alkylhydroperoxidase family enzyme